jgi:GH15 family glucan-1,4-alpha-glucosidase
MGVDGYYVRIAPPKVGEAASPAKGFVPIKNRPPADMNQPATDIVGPDVLALVRFRLRAADDPRIVNTVKVIDHLLKVETHRSLPRAAGTAREGRRACSSQSDGGQLHRQGDESRKDVPSFTESIDRRAK